MLAGQPGPDLAMALAGEGALHDDLADQLGELGIADLGLWTPPTTPDVSAGTSVRELLAR